MYIVLHLFPYRYIHLEQNKHYSEIYGVKSVCVKEHLEDR
jgi:hypothetical protein